MLLLLPPPLASFEGTDDPLLELDGPGTLLLLVFDPLWAGVGIKDAFPSDTLLSEEVFLSGIDLSSEVFLSGIDLSREDFLSGVDLVRDRMFTLECLLMSMLLCMELVVVVVVVVTVWPVLFLLHVEVSEVFAVVVSAELWE